MDAEEIASVLERVLSDTKNLRKEVFRGIERFSTAWTPDVEALIGVLNQQGDLVHWYGRDARPLAHWLVDRSIQVGIPATLEEISIRNKALVTPCVEVLLLTGVTTDAVFKLPGNVVLCRPEDVPLIHFQSELASLKQAYEEARFAHPIERLLVRRALPDAALYRCFEYPRAPFSSLEKAMPPKRELQYLSPYLTLIGPSSPVPLAGWIDPADGTPCAFTTGGGIGVLDIFRWGGTMPLGITARLDFANLLEQVRDADPKFLETLAVPIERLNQSLRKVSSVDKVLDLGIALEALLLDGKAQPQLTLAFSLRAAWLLGTDGDTRSYYKALFKNIYELRSKAAHGNDVGDAVKTQRRTDGGDEKMGVDQFLAIAQKACADCIRAVLQLGGTPNWDQLVLGLPLTRRSPGS